MIQLNFLSYESCGLMRKTLGPLPWDLLRKNLTTGDPLTADFLSQVVFGQQNRVISWTVDKNLGSIRYKQSAGCRVKLEVGFGVETEIDSIFVKRAVPREIPYAMEKARKTPFKTLRDAQANCNEAAFLTSTLVREMSSGQQNLLIPMAYQVEAVICDRCPLNSAYHVLLEDLSPKRGYVQTPFLEAIELRQVAKRVADFHSHFWLEKNWHEKENLAAKLWSSGGYWGLEKQPSDQLDRLEDAWKKTAFELGLDEANLGKRLKSVAVKLDQELHRENPQTLIHGDLKAGNIFFRHKIGSDTSIALIDFQWTGAGRCATDLAYLMLASISPNAVRSTTRSSEIMSPEESNVFVRSFLTDYRDTLESGLNGYEKPSLEALELDYKKAFLDLARVTIADHWGSLLVSGKSLRDTLEERENLAPSKRILYNACNKSVGVAKWLCQCMAQYLDELFPDS